MRALLIKPDWGIMLSVKTEAAGMSGGKGDWVDVVQDSKVLRLARQGQI